MWNIAGCEHEQSKHAGIPRSTAHIWPWHASRITSSSHVPNPTVIDIHCHGLRSMLPIIGVALKNGVPGGNAT